MTITIGSLYAGIGGIEKAFEQAGATTLWANEYDPKACETYKANFDSTLYEEDIHSLDELKLEEVDILTAGFPCQPFSVAGQRLGFKDARGNHFFRVARIIEHLSPQVVFLENVKNLANHDNGNTLKVILDSLQILGYHAKHKVLGAHKYGNIPQHRERIYIVAFKSKDAHDSFEFPDEVPLTRTVRSLLSTDPIPAKYYYTGTTPISAKVVAQATSIDEVYQWRRIYLRTNSKQLCPTLTANMGTGGHNVPIIYDTIGARKLTPKECFAMQGFFDIKFPNKMADASLYKQAGNSVAVTVIARIAENIIKCLN